MSFLTVETVQHFLMSTVDAWYRLSEHVLFFVIAKIPSSCQIQFTVSDRQRPCLMLLCKCKGHKWFIKTRVMEPGIDNNNSIECSLGRSEVKRTVGLYPSLTTQAIAGITTPSTIESADVARTGSPKITATRGNNSAVFGNVRLDQDHMVMVDENGWADNLKCEV